MKYGSKIFKYLPFIDLKEIYSSTNDKVAELALAAFKEKWNYKYPTIADSWARAWQQIIPFLAFPDYYRCGYLYDKLYRIHKSSN